MATAGVHARYPGAQPFADDEASRRVFFGREQLVSQLTNQILGTRLLVMYAKSGQGKTSLLRAGVSQRLRDEGCLPLHVRVNDVQRGPLPALFEGVLSEAQRQGIECISGAPTTLWSFFKQVEFWRGDLLLTPVLILDQFEELFTLQTQEPRKAFLDQLGYLARGVCPPGEQDVQLSPRAPSLHLVLSLREDYLGLLEEAANHIPQILDHRFRLTPLSVEKAQQAMIGPASVDDPSFGSPAFEYEPGALQLITTYLSRRKLRGVNQHVRYVEPFQLQLVCQRVERLVSVRPAQGRQRVSVKDIGGSAGLEATLVGFYRDTLRALPGRGARARVVKLCERHLIGKDGRRRSLEEAEIERQVGLSRELLRSLVQRRLLRTETRAGNTYYELSHDALIEPILARQRIGATLMGWLQLGLAVVLANLTFLVVGSLLVYLLSEWAKLGFHPGVLTMVPLVWLAARFVLRMFSGGVSRLRRFAQHGDLGTLASLRVSRASRRRGMVLIWLAVSTLCAAAYHVWLTLRMLHEVRYGDGSAPFVNLEHWQVLHARGITGMGIDGLAYVLFDLLAPVLALKWGRAGLRHLLQGEDGAQRSPPATSSRHSLGDVLLAALCGLTVLPMLGEQVMMARCKYISGGTLPAGFPGSWYWNLAQDCYTCLGNRSFLSLMLWHLTAPCLLLVAIAYFLRRPAAPAALQAV